MLYLHFEVNLYLFSPSFDKDIIGLPYWFLAVIIILVLAAVDEQADYKELNDADEDEGGTKQHEDINGL